jgi:hypothetical protein
LANKPFNLQDALAGKPVVNGRGEKVLITKLAVPERVSGGLRRDAVLLSQNPADGSILGKHDADGRTVWYFFDDEYRLYMAPTEKEAWVNLYEVAGGGEGLGVATAFTTEYLADMTKHNGNGSYGARRLGGKAFKIVYED